MLKGISNFKFLAVLVVIVISLHLILSNSTPIQLTAIGSFIQNIVVSLVAIVTAYIAWKGLNKWQDEVTFKAEFELAKEVIECTYKVRNAIDYIRYPNHLILNYDYFKLLHDINVKAVIALLEHYDALLVQVEALLDEDTFLSATYVRRQSSTIITCFDEMHVQAKSMLDFREAIKDNPDQFDSYTCEEERARHRFDKYKYLLEWLPEPETVTFDNETKLDSNNLHLNLEGLIENLAADMQKYLKRKRLINKLYES
jgi:hypothetical protein